MRISVLLAGAVAVFSTSSAAQTPDAVARLEGKQGIARVGCRVNPDGRLTSCRVLSSSPANLDLDSLVLEIAGAGQIWRPAATGEQPDLIHFPVVLEHEADYEARTSGPPPPPVAIPMNYVPPNDTATVPALPAGFSGQAWAGLNCVVTPAGRPESCGRDFRRAPPGLLGGMVLYVSPVRTLAGDLLHLPEGLPALPPEVRTSWVRLHEEILVANYLRPESYEGRRNRLAWTANIKSDANARDYARGYSGYYDLREFDCATGQVRRLFSASASEEGIREWTNTQPSDWSDWRQPDSPVAPLLDRVCAN